jgi:hypothetical protein
MKSIIRAIAWPIIITLTLPSFGCSSLTHSTTDRIYVQSLDPQARLYVNDQFIGTGSGTATVQRAQPAMIVAEGNGFCATAIQTTSSGFNPASLRGYVNGAPLFATLADAVGVTQDSGKNSRKTYVVTPLCSPAAPRSQP